MAAVTLELAAAGDVADYTAVVLLNIGGVVAAAAAVDASAVTVTVRAGSVLLGVRIAVPAAESDGVRAAMQSVCSDATSASRMLSGVVVGSSALAVEQVTRAPAVEGPSRLRPPPPAEPGMAEQPLPSGGPSTLEGSPLAMEAHYLAISAAVVGMVAGSIVLLIGYKLGRRYHRHAAPPTVASLATVVPPASDARYDASGARYDAAGLGRDADRRTSGESYGSFGLSELSEDDSTTSAEERERDVAFASAAEFAAERERRAVLREQRLQMVGILPGGVSPSKDKEMGGRGAEPSPGAWGSPEACSEGGAARLTMREEAKRRVEATVLSAASAGRLKRHLVSEAERESGRRTIHVQPIDVYM